MGWYYSENLKLAHFNMFPTPPVKDAKLSEVEQIAVDKRAKFSAEGRGYFALQSTRASSSSFLFEGIPEDATPY